MTALSLPTTLAPIGAWVAAQHRARLVYDFAGTRVVGIVIDRRDPRRGLPVEVLVIRPDANGHAWVEAVDLDEAYHEVARATDRMRVSFEALVAEVRA